eukprot:10500515-Ditylum_brightwellii.AAC.1
MGRVGQRFVTRLAQEFKGARDRRWNLERVLVYISMVLCKMQGGRKLATIRQGIGGQHHCRGKSMGGEDVSAERGFRELSPVVQQHNSYQKVVGSSQSCNK